MSLFDKIKSPVFLKNDSDTERQLAALQALRQDANGEVLAKIDDEIRQVKAGIAGEKAVRFEFENSHIPMFVLHDLYLEYEGLSAQVDYLIVTRKHQYVIECKNLYGNIAGDFIRTVTYGGHTKKEGIYSPITQNRRHLELIKQIRGAEKKNFLTKTLFEKDFYDNYRSVIVLANPKTILNARYAKKKIREQIIRADQLSAYIRKIDSDPDAVAFSEAQMESLARFFLGIHKEQQTDYTAKFREAIEQQKQAQSVEKEKLSEPQQIVCPKCGASMVKRVAAKGPNTGREFYGCSNYPKCRGIVNIQ